MLNLIEDKENNMEIGMLDVFSNMDDKTLLQVMEAGKLKTLCNALSLDLAQLKSTPSYYEV